MKKIASYLFSMTLGFSAGLLTYDFWSVHTPSPEINRPLAVSICELYRDSERYDGKLVQVKAILYGDRGGNPYIVDGSCSSIDVPLSNIMGVYVEPNQGFSVLPQWSTYPSFCGNDGYATVVDGMSAEVILVGIYNSRESQIIPRSVVQLSLVSKGR